MCKAILSQFRTYPLSLMIIFVDRLSGVVPLVVPRARCREQKIPNQRRSRCPGRPASVRLPPAILLAEASPPFALIVTPTG